MKRFGVRAKKHIRVIAVVSAIVLIAFTVGSWYRVKDYGILLEADTMKVYRHGALVTAVKEPGYMMDTFKGIVGVAALDFSALGVGRFGMSELYRLEFIKENKTISVIKLLAPTNPDQVDKRKINNWGEFGASYVILRENGHYFLFGQGFFDDLAEVLSSDPRDTGLS